MALSLKHFSRIIVASCLMCSHAVVRMLGLAAWSVRREGRSGVERSQTEKHGSGWG